MRSNAVVYSSHYTPVCFRLHVLLERSERAAAGYSGLLLRVGEADFFFRRLFENRRNLDRALKSADFTAQAQPWSLVVLAGLGRGYMEMADNFELGARVNRSNPSFFRRQTSDYRHFASAIALQLAQRYRDFEKNNKDAEIVLAFPFPSGSQAMPPAMTKVAGGIAPQQSELDGMQRAELARAMILEVRGQWAPATIHRKRPACSRPGT